MSFGRICITSFARFMLSTKGSHLNMSNADANLDPAHILSIGYSFAASRVLLTAVELDLFTHLQTPLTGSQIAEKLSLHPCAIPDFPDTLVALKIISRLGEGSNALYSNTPESAAFLIPSSPRYNAGMLVMSAKRLYNIWGHLTDCLQTGMYQNEAHPRNGDASSLWSEIFSDEKKIGDFMAAMDSSNIGAHRKLAETLDWSGVEWLIDVGGALGQLCCEVAEKNEGVSCICVDLPNVANLALRNIKRRGMEKKVEFQSGDFWRDTFPKADVLTMGMILHDYNLEKKKILLRKAYEALNEGGRFVAIEMLIDNERRTNVGGMLMSLNMSLDQDGGFDYTPNEFDVWAREVGFVRSEYLELDAPMHAVIAYK